MTLAELAKPEDRLRYLYELAARRHKVEFTRLPYQVPPPMPWWFWLLEAGRGTGKTAAAAHVVQDHLNGPPCISDDLPHRVALIAPTIGDGIESASLNDQALTRLESGARLTTSGGGSRVEWPNGSQVRIFGTHTRDDIERLRAGGNRCMVWAEELAAWRYLEKGWELMMFGLRLGPNPQIVATTTPKARPQYVEIRRQADEISHASTDQNPYLNQEQKDRLFGLYGDTTIGQQELYGKLIEEAEGALWSIALIEAGRYFEFWFDYIEENIESIDAGDGPLPTPMGRSVVAVDPPGGATEAGIVVAAVLPHCECGAPRLPHYGVFADASGKLSPEAWGARTVAMVDEWMLDRAVGESNYGGDMVEAVVRGADPNVSFKMVHASKGKRIRAEPIKALYEQKRVHHVGVFPELEAEMVLWEPDVSEWSPNRLDALVWALTDLSGGLVVDGDLMV